MFAGDPLGIDECERARLDGEGFRRVQDAAGGVGEIDRERDGRGLCGGDGSAAAENSERNDAAPMHKVELLQGLSPD